MPSLTFWTFAAENPAHLAVVDPVENQVPAGELLAAANQLAHGLRGLGLREGDTVSIVLPNCVELLEVYFAAAQIGLYLVLVNWHQVAEEVGYIIEDAGSAAVIGHERFADTCRAAATWLDFPATRLFGVGGVAGFRDYTELKTGQPITPPSDRTAGMVMHYTSGTTGHPKGVRRALPRVPPEDDSLEWARLLRLFDLEPGNGNVAICGSPLYHTAVLAHARSSLHWGHPVVLMDKWTPERMLELAERYRATHTHMVPTQFQRLLALPDDVKCRYDTSSWRHVIHGAAPCPPATKRRMIEWWGPVIDEYYAATEGGGTRVFAGEWLRKPGTVGRAWPGSEVRILDDDGAGLGAGKIGTIYMIAPQGELIYHKDEEKTAASRRGRFFTVGDVGYLDEDGYLFLCDRKIDMIISGGENIYPAEIENVIVSHPAVVDVAVFGIPDEEWGEEVKAVIELAPSFRATDSLADDILSFCRERLARYKLPRTIDFSESLPRDPNGKLRKRKLRDPYWAGRERATG
ncbi:MAG: acyl-CoA synthetase [Streptosporangiaceae bacterium]